MSDELKDADDEGRIENAKDFGAKLMLDQLSRAVHDGGMFGDPRANVFVLAVKQSDELKAKVREQAEELAKSVDESLFQQARAIKAEAALAAERAKVERLRAFVQTVEADSTEGLARLSDTGRLLMYREAARRMLFALRPSAPEPTPSGEGSFAPGMNIADHAPTCDIRTSRDGWDADCTCTGSEQPAAVPDVAKCFQTINTTASEPTPSEEKWPGTRHPAPTAQHAFVRSVRGPWCGHGADDGHGLCGLPAQSHPTPSKGLDPPATVGAPAAGSEQPDHPTPEQAQCGHPSWDGDEGPVALLGRSPRRWRCNSCGLVSEDEEPKPPA